MKHYSPERKEAVIKKMMPPENSSLSKLSEETGISEATLYNWRKQARSERQYISGECHYVFGKRFRLELIEREGKREVE